MNLYSLATIRYLSDKYGFRTSKGLGQNFLTDPSVIRQMVEGAQIAPDDLVIEIGPGIGVLTEAAAQTAARVAAVEVDERLLPVLGETLKQYDNIDIIHEDILKLDVDRLIQEQRETYGITGKTRIVGNLPYYITTPIIMKLLEDGVHAQSITVMMQKEVAQRIRSSAGSRQYGAISVAVQYYCTVEEIVSAPKEVFYPRPKVDSAVLHLQMREEKAALPADEKLFFACVKAGFGQRRKTLRNALSAGLDMPRDRVGKILEEAGVDEGRRAETLSIGEFAAISDVITKQTAEV